MKTLEKIFVALLASVAMLITGVAGASMAMADTPTSETGTLTITNTVAGDKFVAYKILDVISSKNCTKDNLAVTQETPNADPGSCQVVYGKGPFITFLNKYLEGQNKEPIDPDSVTDQQVTEVIRETISSSKAEKFISDILTYKPDEVLPEKIAGGDTVQWTNVAPGYYVIVHTLKEPAKGETARTASKAMVATVLGKLETTVELKNDTVTLEKKITNPTDGSDKGSSYSVGDTVNYELVGTLPDNFGDYTIFNYTFTDVLSAGLTPPNADDIKVEIGTRGENGEVPKDGWKPITPASKEWAAGKEKSQVLTVTMGNLVGKQGVSKDSVIKVTYAATVNADAITTDTGNPNTAKVSFTRSPSSTEEGDTDTPESKTTVYTFQLTLNKVDKNHEPLEGAEFTLYKEGSTTAIGKAIPAAAVTNDGTVSSYTANFKGLAAGTYVIKETKTPTGYNTMDDITIKVVATYNADGSIASLSVTDAKGGAIEGFTATMSSGVISSDIVNNPGSMLPSTGGMGTVMLYAIGGLIVFAAAVGLTLMLRKRNA